MVAGFTHLSPLPQVDNIGRNTSRGVQSQVYYPPEVSSMEYCCSGVFRKEYLRLVTIASAKRKTLSDIGIVG